MTQAANLGFPRIGIKRELKQATEAYWKGSIDAAALRAAGAELRARHWQLQRDAGIAVIPSNDFSFYDQMLDMTAVLGAVPPRFRNVTAPTHPNGSSRGAMEEAAAGAGHPELAIYFAMARGTKDSPAMEMTKWFDTNYHYIVPEFHKGQSFSLSSRKALDEFNEAKALGIVTRPVLIGPVTYLMLGKVKGEELDPLALLDLLLPVYADLLSELKAAGADWVQIDEPVLALDLSQSQKRALRLTYRQLAPAAPKIMLASYFGGYGDNLAVAADLPVAGHHADIVRGRTELDRLLKTLSADRVLSLGVVDGRNIWRADLTDAFSLRDRAGGAERGNAPDRAVLLADPHARRSRGRGQARHGAQGLDGVRQAEAGRGRDTGCRSHKWQVKRGDRVSRQRCGCPEPEGIATHP